MPCLRPHGHQRRWGQGAAPGALSPTEPAAAGVTEACRALCSVVLTGPELLFPPDPRACVVLWALGHAYKRPRESSRANVADFLQPLLGFALCSQAVPCSESRAPWIRLCTFVRGGKALVPRTAWQAGYGAPSSSVIAASSYAHGMSQRFNRSSTQSEMLANRKGPWPTGLVSRKSVPGSSGPDAVLGVGEERPRVRPRSPSPYLPHTLLRRQGPQLWRRPARSGAGERGPQGGTARLSVWPSTERSLKLSAAVGADNELASSQWVLMTR